MELGREEFSFSLVLSLLSDEAGVRAGGVEDGGGGGGGGAGWSS